MSMISAEIVARKKLGKDPEWKIFKWERVSMDTYDVIVEGGTPRLLTRGKNKGKKTWRDCTDIAKCFVTESESDAALREYENETGNCSMCFGEKEVFKRWSKSDGLEMRPCNKCGGTGKRQEPQP
jgi:hypothetical protein